MDISNSDESDLKRLGRLALECSKLYVAEEQILADEGLAFGAFTDEADWADPTFVAPSAQFE